MSGGTALIWLESHFVVMLGVVLVSLAMLLVLHQRRSPQSTAAWLLFILLVPYVAIPVFLALGFRKQSSGVSADQICSLCAGGPAATPRRVALQAFGIPAASDGNHLVMQFTPETARAALFRTIAQAQTRLDIIFYLLDDDAAGHEFVEALIQKAQAGVAVRLILDRLGALRRPKAALAAVAGRGRRTALFLAIRAPGRQRPSQSAKSSKDGDCRSGRGLGGRAQHRRCLSCRASDAWARLD